VWQDLKAFPFQVLAIDTWNGNIANVNDYAFRTGATYPVLRNGSLTRIAYGIAYDNYVLIDASGTVRYTSVGEVFTGAGRWNDAAVRAAIAAHLPAATVPRSWSAVKALYGSE
jgi:hypothetical protein